MKHKNISVDLGADGTNTLQIADADSANDIDGRGHESGKGLRKKVKAMDDVTWSAPPGSGLVIVFPFESPFTGAPLLIQGATNAAGTAVEAVSTPVDPATLNGRYKYTVILTPAGAPPVSEDPQIIVDN